MATQKQPQQQCTKKPTLGRYLEPHVVEQESKIYGKGKEDSHLTDWQKAVNKSAYELAMADANMLYDRGTLKLEAEASARESYVFKKKTGSRSSLQESKLQDVAPKRIKISKEERGEKIASLSTEIEMAEKHIIAKQKLISKANTSRDYQLCDKVHKELRALTREKCNLEKQMKELKKKETKSTWYHRKSKAPTSKTTGINKVLLPPRSTLSIDIRDLFAAKSSSSKTTSTTTITTDATEPVSAQITLNENSAPVSTAKESDTLVEISPVTSDATEPMSAQIPLDENSSTTLDARESFLF